MFSTLLNGSIPTNYIVALEHVRSQELHFLGLDVARRLSRQPKKAVEFSSLRWSTCDLKSCISWD